MRPGARRLTTIVATLGPACSDEETLGRLLFGRDEVARLLLVEHKDAVSAVLLALASRWSTDA